MTGIKISSKSITPQKSESLGSSKVGISPKLKKLIEEEYKMVKGRFKNYETSGGNLSLRAGKYPGKPIFSQTFQDGETYTVPLWVARHLNGIDASATYIDGKVGSCSYPIHGFKWEAGQESPESQIGPHGEPVPITRVAKRTQRYGFESLEFNAPSV